MEHTKGIWSVSKTKHDDCQCIVEADNQLICNTLGGNDEANAAFICTAVNCHDDLIKYGEKILNWVDRHGKITCDCENCQTVKKFKAAIKKGK